MRLWSNVCVFSSWLGMVASPRMSLIFSHRCREVALVKATALARLFRYMSLGALSNTCGDNLDDATSMDLRKKPVSSGTYRRFTVCCTNCT